MATLKVGLVQYDIQWRDKQANFQKIMRLTNQMEPCDLIVLPETFNTGFCVEHPEEAEPMEGQSCSFLLRLAKEKKATVVATLLIENNGTVYNRQLIVSQDGTIDHYDKMHLFHPGNEHKFIGAGETVKNVRIKGFNCRMAICYDLRFPYMTFNDTDFDLLVISANWPNQRIEHWDSLLKARAIENQAFVVAVNRVGVIDGVSYPGHSSIIDPKGNTILCSVKEEVSYGLLDQDLITSYRSKFNFIGDRR